MQDQRNGLEKAKLIKNRFIIFMQERMYLGWYLKRDIVPKKGQKYAMQVSIEVARSLYVNETSQEVSLGTFAALNPKNIRKLQTSHREYCCCMYCINVTYKLLTLSRALSDKDKKKTNGRDICQILLCPKADSELYYKPQCINRTCKNCNNYQQTLSTYYSDIQKIKILCGVGGKIRGLKMER